MFQTMLQGSIVALVTPMKEADQSVDFEALNALIDWQISEGTHAILVLGTTGESPTITADERKRIIETTVKKVAGRVPVMVGTGANDTKASIALTQQAKDLGADAALLVAPYYNKPTQAGLFAHYKAIAEAVDLPQVLYNVPSRTASNIEIETVARLAQYPNLIAIKDVSDSLTRLNDLLVVCKGKMDVLTGDDSNAFGVFLQGGRGVVSVTANVAPKAVSDFANAMLSNEIEKGRRLHQILLPLHRSMFVETNPMPAKWLLSDMGKIAPSLRLPLVELSKQHYEFMRNTFKSID